jgi:hypothetical protein
MVMFTSDSYEKTMYERILAHANCRVNLGRYDDDEPDDYVGSAIEINSYADGENVAVECTRCNEVIIDFNRPETETPVDKDEKTKEMISRFATSDPEVAKKREADGWGKKKETN